MGWAMVIRGLALMAVKQKVQEIKVEEVYSKAVYLPVFYVLISAPGAFFILGAALFTCSAVVQFYPQYFFPTDFILTLGGVALLGSGFSYLVFERILKQILGREERSAALVPPLETKVHQALGPLREQFAQEQAGLMIAFKERKNKSRDVIQSLLEHTH